MNIKPGCALIIIDQQKGINNPKLGLRNNPNAELEILNLLSIWRRFNWPIFHVKHRSGGKESVFWPHQEGFEFKSEFVPFAHETFIEKTTPCAFTKTSLEALLNEKGIDSLVVVGASTNNSVEATVRTGGCIGFHVIVVENACFAFAKIDYAGVPRTAEEVHAMSLANLNGEYAQVIHSSALEYQ
jgi:nicotinamidase-related amidase